MKYIETYETNTAIGLEKILVQKNGIKVRLLKKPSPEYAAKLAARAAAEAIKLAEEEEKAAIRKKIKDEKKRQAIQELLSSGKITQEELDKIGE